MIRERGEPAIADTSKPILEAPVFQDFPQNTQQTRSVADDPDLIGDDDDDDADDVLPADAVDDEDDDLLDDEEPVIVDGDEIVDLEDDEDDDTL
ncbi:hypothetical protein [Dyadobacter sp. CY326]|uniref:hypothetical protein n=1 Tax=Dyadobacter sp. CY326 TaxID=2907300 RepID=UPI001F407F32|nr:hypothetical protein [Dyadobacter sp. CY326]MCE7063690.1 hypothetical protein [Dyadobacter sp. CY326]